MKTEKEILDHIDATFDQFPILQKKNTTINEFLYVLDHTDLGDLLINITDRNNETFSFGWLSSFWTTKTRGKKILQYGVWLNDNSEPVIEIITK